MKNLQAFHEKYLVGPTTIRFDVWNGHILSPGRGCRRHRVVLLVWQPSSYRRRPLNYFFKHIAQPKVAMKKKILSHSTLVESTVFALLPAELQATAKSLSTQVAEFRNEHVEHEMQYWRKRVRRNLQAIKQELLLRQG
jgi:hypothetical protein